MITRLKQLIANEDPKVLFDYIAEWSQGFFDLRHTRITSMRVGMQALCLPLLNQPEDHQMALSLMRQSFKAYHLNAFDASDFKKLVQTVFSIALQKDMQMTSDILPMVFRQYSEFAPDVISPEHVKSDVTAGLAEAVIKSPGMTAGDIVSQYENWDLYAKNLHNHLYWQALESNHEETLLALVKLNKLSKPIAMAGVGYRLGRRIDRVHDFAKKSKDYADISFDDFLWVCTTPEKDLPEEWRFPMASAKYMLAKSMKQVAVLTKDTEQDSVVRINNVFDLFEPSSYSQQYQILFQNLTQTFSVEQCPRLHALFQKMEMQFEGSSAPVLSRQGPRL